MKTLKDLYKELNLENLSFILYSFEKVVIGISNEEMFKNLFVDEVNFIEARFFNENKEIYIWNTNGNLHFRIIENDINREDKNYDGFKDEEYLIWDDDPNRGISIKVYNLEKPKKYLVRNYYRYTSEGLLEFVDARILKFEQEEK